MSTNSSANAAGSDNLRHIDDSLLDIREALLSLRYGSIAVTIHEGRVVQIDITEKKRLNAGR